MPRNLPAGHFALALFFPAVDHAIVIAKMLITLGWSVYVLPHTQDEINGGRRLYTDCASSTWLLTFCRNRGITVRELSSLDPRSTV